MATMPGGNGLHGTKGGIAMSKDEPINVEERLGTALRGARGI